MDTTRRERLAPALLAGAVSPTVHLDAVGTTAPGAAVASVALTCTGGPMLPVGEGILARSASRPPRFMRAVEPLAVLRAALLAGTVPAPGAAASRPVPLPTPLPASA